MKICYFRKFWKKMRFLEKIQNFFKNQNFQNLTKVSFLIYGCVFVFVCFSHFFLKNMTFKMFVFFLKLKESLRLFESFQWSNSWTTYLWLWWQRWFQTDVWIFNLRSSAKESSSCKTLNYSSHGCNEAIISKNHDVMIILPCGVSERRKTWKLTLGNCPN